MSFEGRLSLKNPGVRIAITALLLGSSLSIKADTGTAYASSSNIPDTSSTLFDPKFVRGAELVHSPFLTNLDSSKQDAGQRLVQNTERIRNVDTDHIAQNGTIVSFEMATEKILKDINLNLKK